MLFVTLKVSLAESILLIKLTRLIFQKHLHMIFQQWALTQRLDRTIRSNNHLLMNVHGGLHRSTGLGTCSALFLLHINMNADIILSSDFMHLGMPSIIIVLLEFGHWCQTSGFDCEI